MAPSFADEIRRGIPDPLPQAAPEDPAVSRAPARPQVLSAAEERTALKNALRYFPKKHHAACSTSQFLKMPFRMPSLTTS